MKKYTKWKKKECTSIINNVEVYNVCPIQNLVNENQDLFSIGTNGKENFISSIEKIIVFQFSVGNMTDQW